jgi:16S rRNA (cytosine967-C5)-methyltransferase
MTPAARLNAAIAILDRILAGDAAEQALTSWARGNRFAGSGDRQVIRDHVFDALRRKRSFAHLGGAQTGRGLILGQLRAAGADVAALFTGQGHAPAPLSAEELAHQPGPMADAVRLDCPDWLWPLMQDSLGAAAEAVLARMQHRAPIFVRVNLRRATRDQAIARLQAEGIQAVPHPLAPTALELLQGGRKLRATQSFLGGSVELQDVSSQAVICALPDLKGANVLDYCAGGGGKALAMAALGARVTAHDANLARMQDLGPRAERAGARIAVTGAPRGQFDLVLTDVPCSGSGSWRRAPAGKWLLDRQMLDSLLHRQAEILTQAAALVRPGGWLAYATCSMLRGENQDQIAAFVQRVPGFAQARDLRLTPLDGGDGFFMALMQRES